MIRRGLSSLVFLAALLALGCTSGSKPTPGEGLSPTTGPSIFFTDSTSGPGSGGQDDRGAFVTLYGNGFGETRERPPSPSAEAKPTTIPCGPTAGSHSSSARRRKPATSS